MRGIRGRKGERGGKEAERYDEEDVVEIKERDRDVVPKRRVTSDTDGKLEKERRINLVAQELSGFWRRRNLNHATLLPFTMAARRTYLLYHHATLE
ncbi:hypothetical protein PsYK624_125730 [Phanerochaete sordida]|uniref:Uncharacterized protein n=1 Tax=Phanerochaete sordida TaxID=48140 RepID=A0A9P3GJL2_9APHY|nr:hypothetical protein PsYK624_125730 [Phanerochaete sordida]